MNRFPQIAQLRKLLATLAIVGAVDFSATRLCADSEIVIAIRYLQAQGTSHAHLYLYREDGKLLRQLTNDNSGQDVDPIFAPDGETIVFAREKPNNALEFWSVDPLDAAVKKLDAAPEWYTAAKSSSYFTNRDEEKAEGSAAASATPTNEADAPSYKSPDGSVEFVLKTVPEDEEDRYDGPGHGKHYLVRHLKAGMETEMGKLPGFFGLYELLHDNQDKDRHFLFEDTLRVAFFGLHLNSTDGDTIFAFDVNGSRLVRLSPNWAAPIPLQGEPAFLTLTENRYVPIPGTTKTANCSYMERWGARLGKIRYAREKSAAVCYGASIYRPGRTPATVTIRKSAN